MIRQGLRLGCAYSAGWSEAAEATRCLPGTKMAQMNMMAEISTKMPEPSLIQ